MIVSDPKKSAFGVYSTVPPLGVTVPFVAVASVTVSVSSSGSESFAVTLMTLSTLSSSTVAASLLAFGGSFTAVTVTVTTALSEPPLPSEIV